MKSNNTSQENHLKNFSYNFIYSQIGGLFSLTFTNFIEVMKVRKIMDSYLCDSSHFKMKNKNRMLSNVLEFTKNSISMPKFDHKDADIKKSSKCGIGPSNINKYYYQSSSCASCLPEGNIITLYRHLITKDGFMKVFFGGLQSAMMSHLLRVGIFFPIREGLVNHFKKYPNDSFLHNEVYASILSSGIARTISTIIAFPLDVKKIDYQLNQGKIRNKFSLAKWKIYIPTFFQFYQKELYNTLFFWMIYEYFKSYFKQDTSVSETMINIKSATCAGGLSALLSHPNDYFQTITNSIRNEKKSGKTWDLFLQLKKNNQLTNISSGIMLRTTRGFLINTIFFSIFESMKNNKLFK
jgi:hypothetical protein